MDTPAQAYSLAETVDFHAVLRGAAFLRHATVSVLRARYWEMGRTWSMGPRRLGCDYVNVLLRGRICARVGDEEADLGPGGCFMAPEGVEHGARAARDSRKLACVVLKLHVLDTWKMPLFARLTSFFSRLEHVPYWEGRLRQLVGIVNRDISVGQVYGEPLVKVLLGDFVLNGATFEDMPEVDARVHHALRLIENRFREDLKVRELARACGISEVRLRNLFARDLRFKPKALIVRLRLRESLRLLTETDMNAKEVAYRVGFRDEHYFYNCFKKAYGYTPGAYHHLARGNPGRAISDGR